MSNIFRLQFAYHEMLRTKCFNIYLVLFGKAFQLGIYREYAGNLTGEYLGFRLCPHFPFSPFRSRLFVPSFNLIKDTAEYFMSLDGGMAVYKKAKYSLKRYNYRNKN